VRWYHVLPRRHVCGPKAELSTTPIPPDHGSDHPIRSTEETTRPFNIPRRDDPSNSPRADPLYPNLHERDHRNFSPPPLDEAADELGVSYAIRPDMGVRTDKKMFNP